MPRSPTSSTVRSTPSRRACSTRGTDCRACWPVKERQANERAYFQTRYTGLPGGARAAALVCIGAAGAAGGGARAGTSARLRGMPARSRTGGPDARARTGRAARPRRRPRADTHAVHARRAGASGVDDNGGVAARSASGGAGMDAATSRQPAVVDALGDGGASGGDRRFGGAAGASGRRQRQLPCARLGRRPVRQSGGRVQAGDGGEGVAPRPAGQRRARGGWSDRHRRLPAQRPAGDARPRPAQPARRTVGDAGRVLAGASIAMNAPTTGADARPRSARSLLCACAWIALCAWAPFSAASGQAMSPTAPIPPPPLAGAPYATDDAAHAIGAADAPTSDTAPTEYTVLVMLRLPAPHYRPDAGYGGRYIDDGGRSARRRIAEDLARQHQLKLVSDWPMPTLGVDCYVMAYADSGADSGRRIADTLAHDPRVDWAQPVALFSGMGADAGDPLYPVQPSAKYWHIAELHQTTTGRNVNVAIVDSGVDQQHPDLQGQVALAENFVDGSAYQAEAHGTAVAGIIAARSGNGGIVGVAPGARLLALRACWQQPDLATRCSSFTLAKAINFAILNHAKVINLSLSGPPDRLLDRLVDVALERGIAVVGAVDPRDAGPAFPASHAGVIAVAQQAASGAAKVSGATGAGNATMINAGAGHAASNGASAPDTAGAIGAVPAGTVYAPGRDIPTTAPGARWSFVSGSSFAAAHVSGMLALLDQLQPASTPAQLHRRLLPIDGLNAGNIDACD